MVGFHAFNYARHFLHAAKRLLGIPFQSRWGGQLALDIHGRDARVAISHVGVEAAALERWMASEQAAQVARSFTIRHPGKVIIAGIDSCQRLSGVALKLLAFDRLLEENKVYRNKVRVLCALAEVWNRSRQDLVVGLMLPCFQVVLVQRCEMRGAMNEDMVKTSAELRDRVAKIRATYGDVVDYEEAPSFSPTYRMGLFHRADILLQTPIREGINLLPLEYVYARTQWQIQRSKAFEAEGTAASAAASPAMDAKIALASSVDATSVTGSGHDHGTEERLLPISEVPLPDAALKAISQGMPESYATLAAPPSASVRAQKERPSLRSVFSRNVTEAHVAPHPEVAPVPTSAVDSLPSPSAAAAVQTASRPEAHSALPPTIPLTVDVSAASPIDSDEAAALVAPLPPPLRGGCVILSEFAAASHILNSNLLVNPWNIARVAKEIDVALTMPDHERSFRQWRDYKYAVKTPAAIWSRRVIVDVLETRAEAERAAAAAVAAVTATIRADPSRLSVATLPPLDIESTVRAFLASPTRLLVFDYGGTLMTRSETAIEFSVDGYCSLIPRNVVDAIAGLAQDPRNTVFIVSGKRSAAVEASHLARIPQVGLAAENGWLVSLPARAASSTSAHAAAGAGDAASDLNLGAAIGFEISDTFGAEASAQSSTPLPAHTPVCRQWAPQSASTDAAAPLDVSEWQRVKARGVEIMSDYQWRVNGSVSCCA